MVLITKDYLKSLDPCKDRYKHYLEYYSHWQGTLEEFLDLTKLTREDKKWVFIRSIPKDQLRLVAADFAERVLHIYENKYPTDDRPRKAIEVARSVKPSAARSTTRVDAAAAAAYAAYAAAAYAAAAYAADAAYAAAAYAADAAYAAAYADAADAADAAAADAAAAAYAKVDEKQAQIEIMKRYAREALKGGE